VSGRFLYENHTYICCCNKVFTISQLEVDPEYFSLQNARQWIDYHLFLEFWTNHQQQKVRTLLINSRKTSSQPPSSPLFQCDSSSSHRAHDFPLSPTRSTRSDLLNAAAESRKHTLDPEPETSEEILPCHLSKSRSETTGVVVSNQLEAGNAANIQDM